MERELHVTLGPALAEDGILRQAIAAGATACRINLSHCRSDELDGLLGRVKAAAAACGARLAIGADLRGRKLRLGPFPGGAVELAGGDEYRLRPVGSDQELMGGPRLGSVNCPALAAVARPGDAIALDDGTLQLRVVRVAAGDVVCQVAKGGRLPERSGLCIPGRALAMPALTSKDLADLDALSRARPDFVYLSYCETAADVHELRQQLDRRSLPIAIVAKIESALAIEHLDELVAAADGVCLGRGDLGVEVPLPQLPALQRRVVTAARCAGKPALVAGEVLYSMVAGQTRPTRAEVSDVIIALEQGASGFVLSDETAIGPCPVAAVRWLRSLIDGAGVGSS
ncbi:MAG: hypothetical protein JXR83_19420 [Deltaproteobacteria bacterium]|nr:hypothetical protein [Deltaproteobacteria bacterium]